MSSIDPQLAGNLTYIIQGLIVLFVGADVLILSVWNSRKRLRGRPGGRLLGGRRVNTWTARLDEPDQRTPPRSRHAGYLGILLGALAAFLAIPPVEARTIDLAVAVGIVATLFGVWTVSRGRRRLG